MVENIDKLHSKRTQFENLENQYLTYEAQSAAHAINSVGGKAKTVKYGGNLERLEYDAVIPEQYKQDTWNRRAGISTNGSEGITVNTPSESLTTPEQVDEFIQQLQISKRVLQAQEEYLKQQHGITIKEMQEKYKSNHKKSTALQRGYNIVLAREMQQKFKELNSVPLSQYVRRYYDAFATRNSNYNKIEKSFRVKVAFPNHTERDVFPSEYMKNGRFDLKLFENKYDYELDGATPEQKRLIFTSLHQAALEATTLGNTPDNPAEIQQYFNEIEQLKKEGPVTEQNIIQAKIAEEKNNPCPPGYVWVPPFVRKTDGVHVDGYCMRLPQRK